MQATVEEKGKVQDSDVHRVPPAEQAIISLAMKHNQVIKVVSVYDDHARGDKREFFRKQFFSIFVLDNSNR